MTEDSQKPKKDEQKEVPPPTPPVVIPNRKEDKKPDSKSSTKDTDEKSNPGFEFPQPFLIKTDQEKSKWSKAKDAIPMIALLISIVAVVLNKCSLDNTSKSLAITDSTFKRSIIKDSLASIYNRSVDSTNRIKDSLIIDLAKQSLQAQVGSIQETQNEFKALNEPFLEIDSPQVVFAIDKHITFNYEIINHNKYPARIIDYVEVIEISNDSTSMIQALENKIKTITPKTLTTGAGKYVTFELPAPGTFTGDNESSIYTSMRYIEFSNSKLFVYYGGFFVYENLITNTKRAYKCLLRWVTGDNNAHAIFNKNIAYPIKK